MIWIKVISYTGTLCYLNTAEIRQFHAIPPPNKRGTVVEFTNGEEFSLQTTIEELLSLLTPRKPK